MSLAPRLSIDLEAEIEKITQRQQLNQAHYLVQWARHALALRPSRIEIRSKGDRLSLSQDGAPFPKAEWDLLTTLLFRNDKPPAALQRAIETLEHAHGVAALATLLRFEWVRLDSGDQTLIARDGAYQALTGQPPVSGYRLQLIRPATEARQELKELRFFCAQVGTPIHFNGKAINRPLELENQILTAGFETAEGRGIVGLPQEGELCAISFAKHGVRFGVKQFLPVDGRVFHGYWDSFLDEYEPHYERSIARGEDVLLQQARWLYSCLGDYFGRLAARGKRRVKKVLFGVQDEDWAEQFGRLPLFDGARQAFALSLRDLEALRARFGAVPFAVRRGGGAPGMLPRLDPEDLAFLRLRLALPLTPFNPRPRSWFRRLTARLAHRSAPVDARPLPEAALDGPRLAMLRNFNRQDALCRFVFTEGAIGVSRDAQGRKQVCLPPEHPRLALALARLEAEPEAAPLIRCQLMDWASRNRP